MSITLFSPSSPTHIQSLSQSHSFSQPYLTHKPFLSLKKTHFILSVNAETGNRAEIVTSPVAIVEEVETIGGNGAVDVKGGEIEGLSSFVNSKWVNGTWDLNQFEKDGSTDWDAVIDAEVRRRKWFEENPPSSSNDDPITFDTSIIPWWAWMKRFHLPEAELLNGRAAMIGFFMAYFVDSLTGMGLVDQMGNFFCKTLLFVAVSGVLLIRKNEDFDNIKKLIEESTFYDKQWQATWKDESPSKK